MSQPSASRQWVINARYKLELIFLSGSLLLHLFYPSVLFDYPSMMRTLLYTIGQVLVDKHGVDLRMKRSRDMALLAGTLFVSSSCLLIIEQSCRQLVLVAASVLLLYSNIVLLYHKPQAPKDN